MENNFLHHKIELSLVFTGFSAIKIKVENVYILCIQCQ